MVPREMKHVLVKDQQKRVGETKLGVIAFSCQDLERGDRQRT